MAVFRKAMAFPMFATVAWLVWVLGQQAGIDGAGALLLLLVVMSMVIWAFTLRGRARTVLVAISAASFALIAWVGGQNIARTVGQDVVSAASGPWQDWEPGRVEQLLATGQPVFVDFTASWCVTCQYNKKTVLQDPEVQADLAARNIALLRADWTLRDPAITAALAALGRNGVPLYVLYNSNTAPRILSEILSRAELRAALTAVPMAIPSSAVVPSLTPRPESRRSIFAP